MSDIVQKTFVRSFINYLKKQVDSQALTADAQESVEVAMQCLQAAFDVSDEDDEVAQTGSVAQAPDVAADAAKATNESAAGSSSSAAKSVTVEAKEIDLFELFQSLYIERNPQSLQMAESIKNEGNRLMKECKYNEALLQYNRAITYDPKNPIFYCNRAAAYIRLGENERAITDCKSALVYNANYGKAFGRLGIAYANLGRYNEAQQAYERAIELEPENQDYRNNLEVARSAQDQMRNPNVASLAEGINTMMSHPSIVNMLSNNILSNNIDMSMVQNMLQDPQTLNMLGQMFSRVQGGAAGGGGGGGGGFPPMSIEDFQVYANQMVNAAQRASNQSNSGSGDQPDPQDPPAS